MRRVRTTRDRSRIQEEENESNRLLQEDAMPAEQKSLANELREKLLQLKEYL
ncbi:MAG: hypothetical protein ACLFOY_06140 [Desulfatibacillaceae bacterium]